MTFTSNSDGTITVTWYPPNTYFNANVPANAAANFIPSSFTVTPTPSRSTGGVGSCDPGTNSSSTSLGAGNGYYAAYAVLHTQFGTDPNNTIKDYYQPCNINISYQNSDSAFNFVETIEVYGFTMNTTIAADLLNDPRISSGVYAVGYIALLAVPGSSGYPVNNYYVGQFDIGTNSNNTMPRPPSAPRNFTVVVNSSNRTLASWDSSDPGSAPIAGYKLSWGPNQGGPYPSNVLVTASPSNQQTYLFPNESFLRNGETISFVVQAYDNGTAPLTSPNPISLNSVNYFPPAPSQ